MSLVEKMLAAVHRRLALLVARGVVYLVNDARKMQTLQVELFAGDVRDDVERFQDYGFTSVPRPPDAVGAPEVIALTVGGDLAHAVVIACGDRRYRLQGLAAGEVALHDDQGQFVKVGRNGIVVDGANKQVTFQHCDVHFTGQVTCDRSVTAQQDVVAAGNVLDQNGAKSMAGMRNVFNNHFHLDPQGGQTAPPNQPM